MEDVILDIIVNKLGDTSKKVQCHTIYLLLKLSQAHIEMTEVIVHGVILFLQRHHTKPSHVYYSVAYLNRIASMVAPKDEKVRLTLLRTYFSLFRKILGEEVKNASTTEDGQKEEDAPPAKGPPVKKDRSKSKHENIKAAKEAAKKKAAQAGGELEQEDNKIAELVLKGVNILVTKCSAQLFGQYTNDASGVEMRRLIEEETNSLFRLSHHEVFRIAIQALKLLYQFAKHQKRMTRGELEVEKEDPDQVSGADSITDRFYRALYELLLRPHLTHKPACLDGFFALLFKAVKADKHAARALAFARRILQVATLNDAAWAAASLLIVSELVKEKQDMRFQLYTLE